MLFDDAVDTIQMLTNLSTFVVLSFEMSILDVLKKDGLERGAEDVL